MNEDEPVELPAEEIPKRRGIRIGIGVGFYLPEKEHEHSREEHTPIEEIKRNDAPRSGTLPAPKG